MPALASVTVSQGAPCPRSATNAEMSWTKSSTGALAAPTRRSFGTRMMGSLGQQLNGQVQLAYRPTGFVYELDVPLIALTVKA